MSTKKERCEIKVDGKAELLLPPERAILKVQVHTTHSNKPSSTSGTIESARKVEALLRELTSKNETNQLPAVDYWSRTSLTERENAPYKDGKYLATEYTAVVDFRIQLQTFRKLGSLIHEVVAIEHVASQGVEWVLTAETQKAQHAKLRTMAAKDAVARANDFAAALGMGSVTPVEIVGGSQVTVSSSMKGTRTREVPSHTVGSQSMNMAEAEGWEDVADEAFRYAPAEVVMTQTCAARFFAE